MLTHLPLLLGILLLGCISHFGAIFYQQDIEQDLAARTKSALLPLQQPKIEVNASGQTIVLSGEVISDNLRQQASQTASRVWGVSDVRNLITVAKVVTPVSCGALIDRFLSKESITFVGYGADLDSRSQAAIDQLVTILSDCPSAGFDVIGYADTRLPLDRYNAAATERARAVILQFVLKGISASRFTPKPGTPALSRGRIEFTPHNE
jgi:outer membrane protein OmpA-like peptidoglycan-associated protein